MSTEVSEGSGDESSLIPGTTEDAAPENRWMHYNGQLPVLQSLLFSQEPTQEDTAIKNLTSASGTTYGFPNEASQSAKQEGLDLCTSARFSEMAVYGGATASQHNCYGLGGFSNPSVACWQQEEPKGSSSEPMSAQGTYYFDQMKNEPRSDPIDRKLLYNYGDSSSRDCASNNSYNDSSISSAARGNPSSVLSVGGHMNRSGSPEGSDKDSVQRKSASDRERSRMKDMNVAFDNLRGMLAHRKPPGKRLSKIQALRFAIQYIADLEDVLAANSSPEHEPSFDTYFYLAQAKGYAYAKEKQLRPDSTSMLLNVDGSAYPSGYDHGMHLQQQPMHLSGHHMVIQRRQSDSVPGIVDLQQPGSNFEVLSSSCPSPYRPGPQQAAESSMANVHYGAPYYEHEGSNDRQYY